MPPQVINCDTSKCGICGSSNVYQGGSWTPEKCRDCGAVFFMGSWLEEIKEERCQVERNQRALKTVAVHFVFLACSILVSNTEFAWWLFPVSLTVYLITLGMFIEQLWQEAMKH